MRCAVFGCSNNNNNKNSENKWRFFHFPRDEALAKKWLHFCRRKDGVNMKTACICEVHFAPEDFQRNLQYEMGLAKKNPTKLLPSAFPTKRSDSLVETDERQKRVESRERKQLVERLLNESSGQEEESQAEIVAEEPQTIQAPAIDKDGKIQQLETDIEKLKKRVGNYKKSCAKQISEIRRLRLCVKTSEFQRNNLEERLLTIFTKGQIEKLKNGDKRKRWVEEDIAKSITFYSASPRAYKLLKRHKFPFPAVRTLQCWSQKIDISPGIIEPVAKLLAAATELTAAQKTCVLSFDEMKVRSAFCYDRSSDSTLPPPNYVQVVMLRGLISKWKQPVFYDYDCKMTKSIMWNILSTIKKCGYNVVAVVSDLGGSNRGLYGELGVTMEKPWFLHDGDRIVVFADVPHLIKLIRSNFCDYGFTVDGKKVTKGIISKILSFSSSDVSITHKISSKHLSVKGADRQKVKLATKLFSHTVAKAISRAGTLGMLDGENWEECYKLFKITNDWFDIMNVRVPKEGARERLHAYGLALNAQDNILDQMSDLVSTMRVGEKDYLFPFQKGILQCNNALKLLLTDLREKFKIDYILTYRLNQDVLENFFGVIRSKGGLHDHPDRQEFKYRLRSYILGRNEGVLSEGGNVEVDDTPDLEGNYLSLTGHILKKFSIEIKPPDINQQNPELDSWNNDGLENMAGYICHKLGQEHPEICVDPQYDATYTWTNHLSEGGLSKPTFMMMEQMKAMQAVFDDLNCNSLYICENYIKKHVDLSSHVNCSEKIKELFFRARMYFRIRALNKTIADNACSRKRKLDNTIT